MKEQIKQAISRKILSNLRARMRSDVPWGWDQIRQSVQSATMDDRAKIIAMLLNADFVTRHLKGIADADADAKLANDSLDIDELKEIL